jgi:hypothetical protein
MSDETWAPQTAAECVSRERAVRAEVRADCPFSVAEEYAVDYFRRAEAGYAEAEMRVPVRLLPRFFHRRMAVAFALQADVVEAGRAHQEFRVRWTAGTPLLPNFRGTVRFRIAGPETRVIVDGSYEAPFGVLGRIFDHLIG